ncbi:MAG: hypothetical protein ACU836_07050 [Gammaproteobacteria bacterium]
MNVANVSNQAVIPERPRSTDSENSATQRANLAQGTVTDRDTAIGRRDEASLSAESIELSRASVVRNVGNQTQIPDREQANNLLSELRGNIQSNPQQARQAQANVSPANAARFLAEQVVTA